MKCPVIVNSLHKMIMIIIIIMIIQYLYHRYLQPQIISGKEKALNQGRANALFSKNRTQLDATYYFIVLLIGSTCFGHCYDHHQELATMMLITTFVVSFLVCCMLVLDAVRLEWCPDFRLKQTKNGTTIVVINIIVASS